MAAQDFNPLNLPEGLRQFFLAGVGAMALTGEKGKEVFDKFVEHGEVAVAQGKEINEELKHTVDASVSDFKQDSLYELINQLKPEERENLLNRLKNEKSVKVEIEDGELSHNEEVSE
ncbi:MAG: hypothetical protein Q4E22_03860 [Coriobacteriia bacterium]|nr:hypothetical protein [Coriobacteriia bacterium]